MQSGYGVSEIPQFMVDGICSPFFPVAATGADMSQTQKQHHNLYQPHPFHNHHHHHQQQQQQQQYHHFHQYPYHPHHQFQLQQEHHHHQSAQQPPMQQQPRFPAQFHPIPITQQLFQQTHQFHLFHQEQQRRLQHQNHHQHLGLDQDPTPADATTSPPRVDVTIGSGGGGGGGGSGGGIPAFLGPSMDFRLSVNVNSDGNSRDGLNDGDGILHGDDVDGSKSRWPPPTSREEDAVIKEPFWRPLDLDLEYINRNNKRCKEKEEHEQQQQTELELEGSGNIKHLKLTKETTTTTGAEDGTNVANNYKLFSELEAICKPGTAAVITAGTATNNNDNNNYCSNQTGSSSALTGENPPTMLTTGPSPIDDTNVDEAVDHNAPSDTSTGEEASLEKTTSNNTKGKRSSISKERKRSRRRRRKQQLCSIAAFFETLVKQLMDHQETLHRKFLEVLERKEQERMQLEEAWRQQEATRSNREAKAREQQQAIAAAREAAIVSFLEKITGESISLPTKAQFQCKLNDNNNMNDGINNNDDYVVHHTVQQQQGHLTSRWPKAEVQALIRVRSGLETRFQEPGLKGPLWEEVSSAMSAIGYRRSAKRCKEKWENINKYFRKTKESAKKRPQHSKTCPYFHQLDQLYSNYKAYASMSSAAPATASDVDQRAAGNSELLDAIIVSNDQGGFKFSDMVPQRSEPFDSTDAAGDDHLGATERAMAGKGLLELRRGGQNDPVDGGHREHEEGDNGRGEEEDEDGDGEGEGEDESPANAPATRRHRHDHEQEQEEEEGEEEEEESNEHHHRHPSQDATLFFSRIDT